MAKTKLNNLSMAPFAFRHGSHHATVDKWGRVLVGEQLIGHISRSVAPGHFVGSMNRPPYARDGRHKSALAAAGWVLSMHVAAAVVSAMGDPVLEPLPKRTAA